MKRSKTYRNPRLVQLGCAVLCMCYMLGLFNGFVLEVLHEASHMLAPKTHHHSFLADHEEVDYSSLEAMAGHSHEALEALKELLEANQEDDENSRAPFDFKFDKHLSADDNFEIKPTEILTTKNQWAYFSMKTKWCPNQHLPPPKSV